MSDFDITYIQNLTNVSYIEVLAHGPERVNRLVIVAGSITPKIERTSDQFIHEHDIATISVDNIHRPDERETRAWRGNILINTRYMLAESDQWRGIVQNNTSLLQTTYACLANINTEKEDDFLYAIDRAYADIGPSQSINHPGENELVVHLQIGLQGEASLDKIFYQVHLLLQR